MCLIVQRKPQPSRIHAIPCGKALNKYSKKGFFTPYMGALVPKNGILVAKGRKKYENSGGSTIINGGAIHAYTCCYAETNPSTLCGYYKAYAFGVKAYGTNQDLACHFLYIPDADFTTKKQERVKQCEIWAITAPNPKWKEVAEFFNVKPPHSRKKHEKIKSLQSRRK
jgi:hypothetical protein